ncbi:MAG: TRC40/GET3/ArsA family transport-energizing ATPase [Conexivisphaerales archaeon]
MRVIAYTGKGGVGKSVISSATALRCSEMGLKTLLMSSDPAHTLSDVFGVQIGAKETKIAENLWAVHIDPVDEAMRNYSTIMEYVVELFKVKDIDETVAYELANMPGSTGAAALLKAEDYDSKSSYDVLIMDMVPSGEALRLLYLPYLIGRFSRRLMKMIAPAANLGRMLEPITGMPLPSRNVIDKQVELLDKMEDVRRLLTDYSKTSVRLVMNPDTFSIMNAKRTYMQSGIYGINTDLAIVNKIMPDEVKDSYLSKMKRAQEENTRRVEADFQPLPVKRLKLYREELKGIELLEQASKDLFGDEDPSKIYYMGKPLQVINKRDGIELVMSANLPAKENIEVERIGDELIMHLQMDFGRSEVLIPLPAITFKYKLKGAKLINNSLHIVFGE